MNTRVRIVAAIAATLTGLPALAGNSSSGGGYIYEDQLNPWFLENTGVVPYCVEQDAAVFHLEPTRAREIVADTLAEWKRAFAAASNVSYAPGELEPYGQVRVATQTFVEGACDENTLLRFQLGTLTTEQQQHLQEPASVVASTVRTSYDLEALRGKGFIYVAADAGPLRPTSPGVVDHPWDRGDGALLARVLLHELGHVFGLPHFGDQGSLMGMQHPELIVQRTTVEEIEADGGWASIQRQLRSVRLFGFEDPYDGYKCRGFSSEQGRFFGVPMTWGCLGIRVQNGEVSVWGAPDERQPAILVGKVINQLSAVSRRIVNLKLNEQQRVFTKMPDRDRRFGHLRGPGVFEEKSVNSTYHSMDNSIQRAFKGVFKPEGRYLVDGVLDGRIVAIFN